MQTKDEITLAEQDGITVRRVTLTVLTAIFSINFMDRQILGILVEPIQREFTVSDIQMGLLYGSAFALLYVSAGIPIARLADRANRALIITWSLGLFSVMTIICGLALNYWQLVTARIGIAIGEGGTNPPSHSMISDLYPVSKRSTAMAIFSLGPHIGLFLGLIIGGWAAELWGWRPAFMIAGIIGLVLAALSFKCLREPKRDWSRSVSGPTSWHTIFQAFTRPTCLRHLFAGAAVFSIAAYAVIAWLPSFLIRSYGFSTGTAGTILALVLGLGGGFGTSLGGMLADHLGTRDPAWRLRTVMIALAVTSFFWAAVFVMTNSVAVLVLLVIPGGLLGFFLGPTFAMVQSLVEPSMRATAAAMLLFVINAVGLGLGPIAIGALSDALLPHLGTASLRMALLLILPPLCAWAAYHYHAAARTIGADLDNAVRQRVGGAKGA